MTVQLLSESFDRGRTDVLDAQEKALSQATSSSGYRAPAGLRLKWAADLQTWHQAVKQALARGPGHGYGNTLYRGTSLVRNTSPCLGPPNGPKRISIVGS